MAIFNRTYSSTLTLSETPAEDRTRLVEDSLLFEETYCRNRDSDRLYLSVFTLAEYPIIRGLRSFDSGLADPPVGYNFTITFKRRNRDFLAFAESMTVLGGRRLNTRCTPPIFVSNGLSWQWFTEGEWGVFDSDGWDYFA